MVNRIPLKIYAFFICLFVSSRDGRPLVQREWMHTHEEVTCYEEIFKNDFYVHNNNNNSNGDYS